MRARWPEFELVGLGLELGAQRLAQPAHRRQHLLERLAQPVRRLDQAGIERPHVAFLAEALVLARRARAHLLAHQGQKLLGRAQHRAVGEPRLPVGRGQLLGEVEQAAQRLLRFEVVAQKVAEAPLQPARAAAAASLGAQKPAPQVGGFDAAQMRAEGAVGGVEQVMALVEHVAQRPRGVVEAAHRRLHHDQRVVGDHDVGLPRAADGALDEAFAVVLAGRVDAFAAPVGEPRDAAAAQQVEQPGRQVAADHVAVAAGERPARQQAEADGVLGRQAGAHHRLLEVQQAEVVLAALADHHLARASRPNRGAGGRARCRSGAAGCGCRWRSTPARRSSPPTGRPARRSPGSCRRRCRPRPARRWACPRARAARRPRTRPRRSRSASAAPRRCWRRPRPSAPAAAAPRAARPARCRAAARAAAPPIAAGSSRHRGRRRAAASCPPGRCRGRPARRRPTATGRAPWRARCP